MNRNYIGILYAGKEPNDAAIRALMGVLADILHVFRKDIQIATLNEQEIAKSLAKETLTAFVLDTKDVERVDRVVERSKEILIEQFKDLPEYIIQDKVPTEVFGAYMIHVYKFSGESRRRILASAIQKVLNHDATKDELITATSPKYVAALSNLLAYVEKSQKNAG